MNSVTNKDEPKKKKYNLAVFVSGTGTNLQTIINAIDGGKIERVRISLVLSSNPAAYALARCRAAGLDSEVLREKDYPDPKEYAEELLRLLRVYKVDLIFLAGYLKKIPETKN